MNKDKVILGILLIVFCVSAVMVYNIFSSKTDTKDDSENVQIFSDDIVDYLHKFTDGLKNPS